MFKALRVLIGVFALVANTMALKIEISSGISKAEPIAISEFSNADGNENDIGGEITKIIKADLSSSGLFEPLDNSKFLEKPDILIARGPNPKNWNVLGVRFIVYGYVTPRSGSAFDVDFFLVDSLDGKEMLKVNLSANKKELRKAAHIIANYIYKRISNEDGYFDTQVIYVETVGSKGAKRKTKLIMMDQDGENIKEVTKGAELALTPRMSHDGKAVAYISYNDKGRDGVLGKSAHAYVVKVANGSTNLLLPKSIMQNLIKKNGNKPLQMTYAPRFSNDGHFAVFAIIFDGKSAIYKLDLTSHKLDQLTQHICIDTSPCFSSDGTKIVFTSDRTRIHGTEQIYTMNADGTDVKRISSGEGRYSQPTWSPRGDLIAFAKKIGREFYIGVMKPDGTGERLVTSGYLVEAPAWSSNGRYIIYSTESGPGQKSKLKIVDITGQFSRDVKTRGDASYPSWTPFSSSSESISKATGMSSPIGLVEG